MRHLTGLGTEDWGPSLGIEFGDRGLPHVLWPQTGWHRHWCKPPQKAQTRVLPTLVESRKRSRSVGWHISRGEPVPTSIGKCSSIHPGYGDQRRAGRSATATGAWRLDLRHRRQATIAGAGIRNAAFQCRPQDHGVAAEHDCHSARHERAGPAEHGHDAAGAFDRGWAGDRPGPRMARIP